MGMILGGSLAREGVMWMWDIRVILFMVNPFLMISYTFIYRKQLEILLALKGHNSTLEFSRENLRYRMKKNKKGIVNVFQRKCLNYGRICFLLIIFSIFIWAIFFRNNYFLGFICTNILMLIPIFRVYLKIRNFERN